MGKYIKYVLWICWGLIVSGLTIGYLKYDRGMIEYIKYLNKKDRIQTVNQMSVLKPTTWTLLFWDSGVNTGMLIDDINTDTVTTGEDNKTGYNSEWEVDELENDFDKFFEGESIEEVTGDDISEESIAGFKVDNEDTSTSGEVDDKSVLFKAVKDRLLKEE